VKLLDVYHRLPYAGRCLAAGARGLYLRAWRYGRDTPGLVADALARESWTADDWRLWRSDALRLLLRRAVARVPYYRDLWKGRPESDWESLESWPVLRKEEVRRDPRAFLADDCDPRWMFREATSGSTGTPLAVWWSRRTTVAWYALVEARMRAWNGLDRRDPWAILGGQLVAPAGQRTPPYWVWNQPLRQLYLSSYHLEPGSAAAYLEALESHGVRYLLGYPSAMAALAELAREAGLRAPRLEVALTNAEPLFERQRRRISEVFGCPVRDTYGTAELAVGASECAHGRLHLWPEVGIAEVFADDEDVPARAGECGRLITTGLLNADMPLVRYEVGDRGALAAGPGDCPCGRRLPVLAQLEGRLDDVVVTPEGRRVGRLDPVFKADLPIREAQIVQVSRERVVLRVVPAPGFGRRDEDVLAERLRARLGPSMEIAVERVSRLARGRAGKLRAVVSLAGAPGTT
jgi:phenylacetate-CoA ligase